MLFHSATYLLFLPLSVAVFWAVPPRRRVDFLLVASYVFYASWSVAYAALLFALVLLNWWAAVWAIREQRLRSRIVGTAVGADLAVLALFKYTGFATATGQGALALVGLPPLPFEPPALLLPLGISFFTFELIHFLVDVRRGSLSRGSFAQFHVFTAFFPTQIAGPIKRFQEFAPQLERRTALTMPVVSAAAALIARGLFKKMVLADNIGPIAGRVFDGVAGGAGPTTLDAWVGVVGFALQIYMDFSGYTDIARGSARLFGFEIPPNFRQPYLARNAAEFWERWHISLSRWLRDYLYITLGGSRRGRWLTRRNLLLTMLLGGLWHGAAWQFVVWGAYWGVVLVLYHGWHDWAPRQPGWLAVVTSWTMVRVVLTMIVVLVGWAFFRAPVSDALDLIGAMFVPRAGLSLVTPGQLVLVFGTFAAYYAWVLTRDRLATLSIIASAPVRGAAYSGLLVLAVLGAPPDSVPFIYFQF